MGENILGISDGGVSGVALFINNELELAVNEERFTNIKLDKSYPFNSIEWILKESGLSPNNIDYICYGFSDGKKDPLMNKRIKEYDKKSQDIILDRIRTQEDFDTKARKNFYEKTSKLFPGIPVYNCSHHQSHQACAYMASPFKESLIITADGRGDYDSVTISKANSEGIDVLYNSFTWESLGYLYGRITKLCGFTPERHEGKILGLSAHGDPLKAKSLIDQMITLEDGKIRSYLGDYYRPWFSNYSDKLKNEVSKFTREDLAAATQLKLEEIICSLVSHYIKKTSLKNVCVAGGVFANVKLNQKIREMPEVNDIFVYPSMGDDGICAGAVYRKFLYEGVKSNPIKSLYLGPQVSNDKLKNLLDGCEILKPKNIYSEVVKLLVSENAIALVQGRAEFGPRSLGNRSILITPDSDDLILSLNKRLGRSEFMPFAPIISSDLAEKCLENYSDSHFSSRHMVTTYNVTNEFKINSPAVVHIDNTVRPQVVFKEDNIFLYELLNTWYRETGKLCLINTSFNLHEDPIASLETDIVRSFKSNAVDYLLFPPYLALKK